jgi:hypothetical protein
MQIPFDMRRSDDASTRVPTIAASYQEQELVSEHSAAMPA